MGDYAWKPSEIKLFLRNKNRNYWFKQFLDGGNFPKRMLFHDAANNREVIGKLITSPSKGELYYWPKFQHENILRLLDVLSIDEDIKIFIAPVIGKRLDKIIHEVSFAQHPLCFDRKKAFVRDILRGVDYLHEHFLCLLNLSDANVLICHQTDKAILADFSQTVPNEEVTKLSLPVSSYYKPPEINNGGKDKVVDGKALDMWAFGIMLLQIFTQHLLPWGCAVRTSLAMLDFDILKQGNPGSHLQTETAVKLKEFISLFLTEYPEQRISTTKAIASDFLYHGRRRLDSQARCFWEIFDLARNISSTSLDAKDLSSVRENVSDSASGISSPQHNSDCDSDSDLSNDLSTSIERCQIVRTKSAPITKTSCSENFPLSCFEKEQCRSIPSLTQIPDNEFKQCKTFRRKIMKSKRGKKSPLRKVDEVVNQISPCKTHLQQRRVKCLFHSNQPHSKEFNVTRNNLDCATRDKTLSSKHHSQSVCSNKLLETSFVGERSPWRRYSLNESKLRKLSDENSESKNCGSLSLQCINKCESYHEFDDFIPNSSSIDPCSSCELNTCVPEKNNQNEQSCGSNIRKICLFQCPAVNDLHICKNDDMIVPPCMEKMSDSLASYMSSKSYCNYHKMNANSIERDLSKQNLFIEKIDNILEENSDEKYDTNLTTAFAGNASENKLGKQSPSNRRHKIRNIFKKRKNRPAVSVSLMKNKVDGPKTLDHLVKSGKYCQFSDPSELPNQEEISTYMTPRRREKRRKCWLKNLCPFSKN